MKTKTPALSRFWFLSTRRYRRADWHRHV